MDLGGTIASGWDPTKDTAIPLDGETPAPDYIRETFFDGDQVKYSEIAKIDSRLIDEVYRTRLAETIARKSNQDIKNFVVGHGTYTKADTARFLKENLKEDTGTIVMLSSMQPLAFGANNGDAAFNAGFAAMASTILENGTYVSANGQVFHPDFTDKDLNNARFMDRRYMQDEQRQHSFAVNSFKASDAVTTAVINSLITQTNSKEIADMLARMSPEEIAQKLGLDESLKNISNEQNIEF